MSSHNDSQPERDTELPATIRVPGGRDDASLDALSDEDLAEEIQRVQDLGSASRSCVAIIAVLLIMALLLCVFIVWALVLQ